MVSRIDIYKEWFYKLLIICLHLLKLFQVYDIKH